MAVTPEGKVKKMVNGVLDEFVGPNRDELYRYWPVPSGFGASSLDCIVCYRGVFIAIEAKAPGKKPTPRQDLTIAQMMAAGGQVLVISNVLECSALRIGLEKLRCRQ